MKRSTSMSYVDDCIRTWPKEKQSVQETCQTFMIPPLLIYVYQWAFFFPTNWIFFLLLFFQGNFLWDSFRRRRALRGSIPPRYDPLGQQWRSGLQSSLCISRRHEAATVPAACRRERPEQTNTGGGGGLHPPQTCRAEPHILRQEPKQVQVRTADHPLQEAAVYRHLAANFYLFVYFI